MLTLKNGFLNIFMIISYFYLTIRCSPVYDMISDDLNSTSINFTDSENEDLKVVSQKPNNKIFEFAFDDNSVDELGSGNADIIINVKFPENSSEPTDDKFESGYGDLIINLKSPLQSFTSNSTVIPISEEEIVFQSNNSDKLSNNEDKVMNQTSIQQNRFSFNDDSIYSTDVMLMNNETTIFDVNQNLNNNSINIFDNQTSNYTDLVDIVAPLDTTTEAITLTTETTTTTPSCPVINCQTTTFLSQIIDYEDIYEMYTPPTSCNFGRIKNKTNDCDTCDCAKNPDIFGIMCQDLFCLKPCYYGAYKDADGCDTCACKPRPLPKSVFECPQLECPSCNYGAIKDEFGCETCVCFRPNSKDIIHSCLPEPQCPFGPCLFGSVLNDFGCSTCDCLRSAELGRKECPTFKCKGCKNGYYKDTHGCQTCKCKPDQIAPCSSSNYTCDQSACPYGTYLDRNGCPSCECLPNPYPQDILSCEEKKESNGFTIEFNNELVTFPECNENDPAKYRSKTCNEKECVCLTPEGHQISDFKAPLDDWFEMHCECARLLYRMSVNKEIGFKLFCQKNGNFEDIQCSGSTCGCVTHFGDAYGPSVPMHQKHLLRCYDIYQRIFQNKFEKTTQATTLSPPLCIYHRDRAIEMSGIDRHIPIPRCDTNGLYEPVQCDRYAKYCWCVNVHNGVELYGTGRSGELPDCINML